MNFIKLSYNFNGTVLPLFIPAASIANGGYFKAISGGSDEWANTLVTLSSGVSLPVIETAEEIVVLTDSVTVTANAPSV